MFYKDNYQIENQQILNNNPLEFALSLAEKTTYFYKTGYLQAKNTENIEIIKPVVFNDSSYFESRGERSLSAYNCRIMLQPYPDMTSVEIVPADLSHLPYNKEVKEKIDGILADFFNLKKEITIKDKNDDTYQIKIIETERI